MSLMALLSNAALAMRYLKLITLLPPLLVFVQAFETSEASGPAKKARVLLALDVTTNILERQGFITAEMNTKADALASELIDVIVESFNVLGIFSKGTPGAISG